MDEYQYDETSPARAHIIPSPTNTSAERAELYAAECARDDHALLPADARQQNRPLLSFGMVLSHSRSVRSRR
jgi:hypothetical protein